MLVEVNEIQLHKHWILQTFWISS